MQAGCFELGGVDAALDGAGEEGECYCFDVVGCCGARADAVEVIVVDGQ